MSHESNSHSVLREALLASSEILDHEDELAVELAEVLAFVRHELPDEEHQWLAERILDDPNAIQLAAAVASFEASRQDMGNIPLEATKRSSEGLSKQEIDLDWQRLTTTLGLPSDEVATPSSANDVPSEEPVVPFPTNSSTPSWIPQVAAAGWILAAGIGLAGFWSTQKVQLRPRTDIATFTLWEDATRRGAAESMRLDAEAAFQLLTLTMAPADATEPDPHDFPQHQLEIWSSTPGVSGPVWRSGDVIVERDLTVTLELARGFLEPGRYEVRLAGIRVSGDLVPLATFAIEQP